MTRPVRRLFAAIALAVVFGAAGGLAAPSIAEAAASDAPVAIAPDEGTSLAPGTIVLEWTAVAASDGYEVTWSTGADGGIGSLSTAEATAAIEVESGSVSWQVRALPDGEWSAPATFHVDPELPTLAVPEQPAEQPAAVPAVPDIVPPGVGAIPGGVWILGALGFSVVFLAVVVIQSRVRRERDA